MKEKDISVELFRIIGMMMVLGCHVNHGLIYFDQVSPTGSLISCVVGDGVAVFWMIMGFFLFKSDYKHVLKRSVRKILIPMFLFSILMFYFGEFLCGDSSDILFGFKKTIDAYKDILFEGLLKWRTRVSYTSQFWYLYSYMVVVLAFPALMGVKSIVKTNRDRLIFILVVLGIIIINDISMNELLVFSNTSFPGAVPGAVFVLLGNSVYSMKDKFAGKIHLGILGLLSFFVINAVRSIIQYNITLQGGSNHLIYWFTSFGMLTSFSLILFVYGIEGILKNGLIRKIIAHIGGLTMGIYFVHLFVLAILKNLGVYDFFENALTDSPVTILLVQLGKTLSVFIGSLIIVEAYHLIKLAFCRLHSHVTAS